MAKYLITQWAEVGLSASLMKQHNEGWQCFLFGGFLKNYLYEADPHVSVQWFQLVMFLKSMIIPTTLFIAELSSEKNQQTQVQFCDAFTLE